MSRRAKSTIKAVASHKFFTLSRLLSLQEVPFCELATCKKFLHNHNFSSALNVSINFYVCSVIAGQLFEDVRASIFRAGDKNVMNFYFSTVNDSKLRLLKYTKKNSDFVYDITDDELFRITQ